MLTIRKAENKDTTEVIELYKKLIDQIKDYKSNPNWKKDIHPSKRYLIESISSGDLYVGVLDSKIVSSIVINHIAGKEFDNVNWNIDIDNKEAYYVHLVAVDQEYSRRGIAKKMLKFSFKLAKDNNVKSIRLSLNRNNLAIEGLYTKLNFVLVETVQTYVENRGTITFNIYEKLIN